MLRRVRTHKQVIQERQFWGLLLPVSLSEKIDIIDNNMQIKSDKNNYHFIALKLKKLLLISEFAT